jgi:hypothetical protein
VIVLLSRQQVKDSPDVDTHQPISRQEEANFLAYYGNSPYWGGTDLLGGSLGPGLLMHAGMSIPVVQPLDEGRGQSRSNMPGQEASSQDAHLRSSSAVTGYHVLATDGEIGHVDGMLIDPRSWTIRFLIVNTSNWWLGYRVMIATRLVRGIRWAESSLAIDLSREAIKNSHVYDESQPGADDGEYGLYGGD